MIAQKFAHRAALVAAPFAGLWIYSAVMAADAAAAPHDTTDKHTAQSAVGSHRPSANAHNAAGKRVRPTSASGATTGIATGGRGHSAARVVSASVVESTGRSAAAAPRARAAAMPNPVVSALTDLKIQLTNAASELDSAGALLQTQLNFQMQRFNELAEQWSAELKRRAERIDARIRAGLEDLEEGFDALESRFDDFDMMRELDELDDGFRARLAEIEDRLAEIEDLVKQKSNLAAQLSMIRHELERIWEQIR